MIKESVGNAAVNRSPDVEVVKALAVGIDDTFNVAPSQSERKAIRLESGKNIPTLVAYLARFQRMAVPIEAKSGGRVMPQGETLKKLLAYAKSSEEIRADALKRLIHSTPVLIPKDLPPPQALIIRELRVKGVTPSGKEVLEVGAGTLISSAVRWVVDRAKEYEGNVIVKIIAHGNSVCVSEGTGSGETKNCPAGAETSKGGGGLEFCKEDLRLGTLYHFAAWNGWIRRLDLVACSAAYTTPGTEGKEGDGRYFCSRLAKTVGAPVRAAIDTQIMVNKPENPMDPGPWEGTVLTFGREGTIINTAKNPEK